MLRYDGGSIVPVNDVSYVIDTSSDTQIATGSTVQAVVAISILLFAHQNGPTYQEIIKHGS